VHFHVIIGADHKMNQEAKRMDFITINVGNICLRHKGAYHVNVGAICVSLC
jgi:hypothetical protein